MDIYSQMPLIHTQVMQCTQKAKGNGNKSDGHVHDIMAKISFGHNTFA